MSSTILHELRKNSEKKRADREAVKVWLAADDVYTHEVTLTFPFDPKRIETAEMFYGIFRERLNERCFKKKFRNDIVMTVLLEGEISNKRLHYHCAMQCPQHMTYERFTQRITKTWRDVVGSKYTRVDIKTYTDADWIEYGLKEFTITNTSVISAHCNL